VHVERRKGWHTRGYVPHFDGEGLTQGVTIRLADAVPMEVISRWEAELQPYTPEDVKRELHRRIDQWLDAGHGECLLRDPAAAKIMQDALLFFDGERYEMLNWCIMPNHVHTLFNPLPGYDLAGIVHSWKSYTAKKINSALQRQGQFWMPDYFDRYIRDQAHFDRAMKYVDNNPVKAGLCEKPEDWPWCGAAARVRRKPD
jgi:REP element-mobilizing transposase RayT